MFPESLDRWAGSRVGSVLQELFAAFRDAGTQWMISVCEGVYFIAFCVVRRRLTEAGRVRMGCNASVPIELWLAGLVGAAALAYAFDYTQAVKSTQALTLLGGAVIGQGAALWEGRTKNAECRREIGGMVVGVLIFLLAVAAMWQGEPGRSFQYRGRARWAGPWDNPNTFGMLMGVGMVLVVGRLVLGKAEGRKLKAEMGGVEQRGNEHRTSNAEHRTLNWGKWLGRALYFSAAGVMAVGLVKSYSRGAWVGTVVGVAYLAWQIVRSETLKAEIRRRGWWGAAARNRVALGVVVVSLVVIGLWSFRQAEGMVVRRAYSVANANDFSWRNRLAAYEGALQMMSDRPWFGFGWNEPERVCERYYRTAKAGEGAAIQLNDYLMLGMTLGVPALACFVVYVGFAVGAPRRTSNIEHRTSNLECRTSDSGRWTSDLAAVCRAGTIVLLVGFWFDGGLFKLASYLLLLLQWRAARREPVVAKAEVPAEAVVT